MGTRRFNVVGVIGLTCFVFGTVGAADEKAKPAIDLQEFTKSTSSKGQ